MRHENPGRMIEEVVEVELVDWVLYKRRWQRVQIPGNIDPNWARVIASFRKHSLLFLQPQLAFGGEGVQLSLPWLVDPVGVQDTLNGQATIVSIDIKVWQSKIKSKSVSSACGPNAECC